MNRHRDDDSERDGRKCKDDLVDPTSPELDVPCGHHGCAIGYVDCGLEPVDPLLGEGPLRKAESRSDLLVRLHEWWRRFVRIGVLPKK